MRDLNKVMIIGNVGSDPEMRFTANGTPVSSFSVAVSRVYNGPDGERRQETEWFNIVTWDKLAETCNQYLTKGRRAYIEGRLQIRSWEGSDGQKRFRPEIVATNVLFLDRKTAPILAAAEEGEGDLEADELPF